MSEKRYSREAAAVVVCVFHVLSKRYHGIISLSISLRHHLDCHHSLNFISLTIVLSEGGGKSTDSKEKQMTRGCVRRTG